jgi:surfactin synthase thioesterase subunit
MRNFEDIWIKGGVMKLICFPHAGGFSNYYSFFNKSSYFLKDSIYYYEYPGRGSRICDKEESAFDERVFAAADYVRALGIEANQYAIFGHSMGAFVACEVGQVLQNRYGLPPAVVFLSGQVPPCTITENSRNEIFNSDDGLEFMSKLGGVPDFIRKDSEIAEYYSGLLIADLEVMKTYNPIIPKPEERLQYGILLYGSEDIMVTSTAMHLWNANFKEICSQIVYPGNHFYISIHAIDVVKQVDFWSAKFDEALPNQPYEKGSLNTIRYSENRNERYMKGRDL